MNIQDNIYYTKSIKYENKIELFQTGGGSIKKQYEIYRDNRKNIERIELSLDNLDYSNSKIAIIVPYRNNKFQPREHQLTEFINYYYNYINNVDIYIIEQSDDNKKFNRGALLNIGYDIAKKHTYDMYIFHDVDLLSSDSLKKVYSSKSNIPIHIASIWNQKYSFNYALGGIISFNKESFEKINGFPNKFYGWGGEDDAVYNRLINQNISIHVLPKNNDLIITEMKHDKTQNIDELVNKNKRNNILNDLKYWKSDGLSHLKYNINYEIKMSYDNVKKINVSVN